MRFTQFLTEVTTGDLVAFRRAVENQEFHDKEDVIAFFEQRGYKRIGYGWFATVLRSTKHFVVKIAEGDSAFHDYVNLIRRGRMNPHFPTIVAQMVPTQHTEVFFIEALIPYKDVTVDQLVQHHTKEDVGMFLWLIYEWLIYEFASAMKAYNAARSLDPSLELEEPPTEFLERMEYKDRIPGIVHEILPSGHSFAKALKAIQSIRPDLDIHPDNIMVRPGTFDIVFTDPVADPVAD